MFFISNALWILARDNINNFWMAHKRKPCPRSTRIFTRMFKLRLDEAERVGYGFALPVSGIGSVVPIVPIVPIVPKVHQNSAVEIAA
jgi:hypothetical protein